MNWICKYCGKDTSNIEYDYLDGHNHLSCTLEYLYPKNKAMKIKNWDKIRGYTYKGYCIVNPNQNIDETKYYADVINLNVPQKPVLELSLLTPKHKFMDESGGFQIFIFNKQTKLSSNKILTKEEVQSLDGFLRQYERLIDVILDIEEKQKFKPVTGAINFNMNATGSLIW